MPQSPEAIVREVLAAWNDQDLERWLVCWDPTCVWVPKLRGQVEGAQTYRGHEGLRRFCAEDETVWEAFWVEPHDFRQVGDEVIAIGTGTARGKQSGLAITTPFALRFRIRDGKVVRGESYLDLNEALEAVGLSE
jgi:ketosteroid isomerase-like protein